MARISTIIAVKDMESTIYAALTSVLLQSHRDLEIIVVDNGSTDATVSIVQRLMETDKRISLQYCATPGPFACRNQAMRNLDCEFMAVMDGDDICLPTRLEEQAEAMRDHVNLSAVGSRIVKFGDDADTPNMALSKAECRDLICLFNPCAHPTLLVRQTALEKTGPYDLSYTIGADYDFVRRLTYCGDVENLARHLLLYRIHDKQITSQRKQDQKRTAYSVIKKHVTYLQKGRPASDRDILWHMGRAALHARLGLKRQACRSMRAVLSVIAENQHQGIGAA